MIYYLSRPFDKIVIIYLFTYECFFDRIKNTQKMLEEYTDGIQDFTVWKCLEQRDF